MVNQKMPQTAKVPNLDAIAYVGINGLMDPVEVGLGCSSDTAHLSLLGYDPHVYYRGRGAFESMGAGLAMAPGDIAFKASVASSPIIPSPALLTADPPLTGASHRRSSPRRRFSTPLLRSPALLTATPSLTILLAGMVVFKLDFEPESPRPLLQDTKILITAPPPPPHLSAS
ncbi:hypothetical protein R6Q59_014178 [Mikania micrantha]